MTPMKCLFEFTAETPTNLKHKSERIYNSEDSISEIRIKLQQAKKLARECQKRNSMILYRVS